MRKNHFKSMTKVIPMSYWPAIGGFITISINALVNPEDFANVWLVSLALFHLVFLIIGPNFPLPMWTIYIPVFIFMNIRPDTQAPALIFIAPVLAAIVSYRGHLVPATIGTIALWYVGSIDLPDRILIPQDFLASLVWAAILCISVSLGRALYCTRKEREKIIKEWNADVQKRRESLGRILHDSVAASLTSFIMRLESIRLDEEVPEKFQQELLEIANQARVSMREVRSLLHTLSSSSEEISLPTFSVANQIHEVVMDLKKHGFTVETMGAPSMRDFNAEHLIVLHEVLRELGINIVKYAEPKSLVKLTFRDQKECSVIQISNSIASDRQDPSLSTGLGLSIVSQLTASIGIMLRIISNEASWTAEITIPQSYYP